MYIYIKLNHYVVQQKLMYSKSTMCAYILSCMRHIRLFATL